MPMLMLMLSCMVRVQMSIDASAGPSPSTPETSAVRSITDKTKPLPICMSETMPSAVVDETKPAEPTPPIDKSKPAEPTPPLIIEQTPSKPEGGDGLDIQEGIGAKKAAGKKGKGNMAKGKEEKNPIVEPAVVVKKRPASKMEGHTSQSSAVGAAPAEPAPAERSAVHPGPRTGGSERPPMPALEKTAPINHHGCRIYTSVADKKWRVMPKPGESLYDKGFAWGADPQAKWRKLLDYCEAPMLPPSHA